jgi:release factor glutamine methyltransferase
MKTLEDLLREGKLLLKENNIVDGDLDAWLLLSHFLQIDRGTFFLNPKQVVTDVEYEGYMDIVRKRSNHIPLQHITGEQEFMGLQFKVSESVLIPRQDTEVLVEEILKVSKGKEVLDLCTGSGCIIISLDKLGNIKHGVGVDISFDALNIAKQNAKELDSCVSFLHSDLYQGVEGKYDIIVSNPPYIPTNDITDLMEEVKIHEPMLALDGKGDGLYFYRLIIDGLNQYLKVGGYVFFEIGYNQGDDVMKLLSNVGVIDIRVLKDLAGLDRVVCGRLGKDTEPFT